MRQFDVVRLRGNQFAIVMQSSLLDELESRVVAPLFPAEEIKAIPRLHPAFEVDGKLLLLATEKLSVVRKRDIEAVVSSAADREYELRRALDIVFTGL